MRSLRKNPFFTGTLLLTLTSFISRIIGFFYRIFLSQVFGAEGMGIYQLIGPVLALSFSLCASGIQTAISKYVATETSTRDYRSSLRFLCCGLFLSTAASGLCTFIVYRYSESIAAVWLMEPRTAPLLRIIALSFPFGVIHSCVNGYFYGIKKAKIPAATQLIEQVFRVGSVYLIYACCLYRHLKPTIAFAVVGLIIGDAAAMLFSLGAAWLRFVKLFGLSAARGHFLPVRNGRPETGPSALSPRQRHPSLLASARSLLSLAIPLSANRVVINLLQSVEAVFIPQMLQQFGLSPSQALGAYGVLTGMALSIVLFPSALPNSASVLMLPVIAEADSYQDHGKIRRTIRSCIKACLVFGFLCTAGFFLFGRPAGQLLFHSSMAGEYIVTLSFICPFLYLTTMLSSILNGLGKAGLTFSFHVVSLLVRLAFVFFCIPLVGVKGYLWGLLASELAGTCLFLFSLRRYLI